MKHESDMKERILKSAFELFSSKGYDKVSLNDVVEKAGVSKGGLFHYFDSKYSLARDCLIWWTRKNMKPNMFMEGTATPRDMLIRFIDLMIHIMQEEEGFTRFFWSVFDEAMSRQEDPSVWVDFLEQYKMAVSTLYEKMEVRDPEMKALMFLSNMDGMTFYHSMLKQVGTELDLDRFREELIRTYVDLNEEAG
ncbi:MAG: helix-turn-helix domain-containing protein [Thermoplasmatota archaeon]